MRAIKRYVTAVVFGLSLVLGNLAVASETATLAFSRFTQDSAATCKEMFLDESAKAISITVDLSSIKDRYTGAPKMVASSGMSLSSTPEFFFMGVYGEYAYMSYSADALVQNKPYSLAYFTLVSKNQYSGYKSAMRLNDEKGNACILVLQQA